MPPHRFVELQTISHFVRCRVATIVALIALLSFSLPAGAESTRGRIIELNPHLTNGDIPNLDLKLDALSDSAFTYFRGTCDLYAAWFKDHCTDWTGHDRAFVRLHGDVHPGNCGTYVSRSERGNPTIEFGLVDFDETFIGPFEYDLLRAIVSLRFVAAERNIKLNDKIWRRVSTGLIGAYRNSFDDPAAGDDIVTKRIVKKVLQRARKADAAEYLAEYTTPNPPVRFRSSRLDDGDVEDVLFPLDASQRDLIVRHLADAARREGNSELLAVFESGESVSSIARWVRSGSSGSQGVRKFLVLVSPMSDDSNACIYQLKEEPRCAAVRAGLVNDATGSPRAKEVYEAMRAMPRPSPSRIGWMQFEGVGYLVKPKTHNAKEPKTSDFKKFDDVAEFGHILGRLLGAAHAQTELTAANREAIRKIAADPEFASRLCDRSRTCFEQFSKDYVEFAADPETKLASQRAVEWMRRAANRPPDSPG